MSFERKDLVRIAGEGEAVQVFGAEIAFKAVSEGTGQGYALFENTAPPSYNGSPPQIHDANEDIVAQRKAEKRWKVYER